MQTNSDKSNGLKLSYDVSEIISSDTKSYLLHKNPLANAESLVKKNQFKSALEIYSRTLSKITEESIQNKIKANILDIQNYLKAKDPDFEKNYPSKFTNIKEKEFNKSLEEFSESLSDSLTEKLNVLKQIETVPEIEVDREFPYDLGKLEASNFPQKKGKNKPKKSDSSKNREEVEDDSESELELTAELGSETEEEESTTESKSSTGNKKEKKQKGKLNLPEEAFKPDLNLESIQIDKAEIEAEEIQTNSETYNEIYSPEQFTSSPSSSQNQEEEFEEGIEEQDELEEEVKPKKKSKKSKKKTKKQTNRKTKPEEDDSLEEDSTESDSVEEAGGSSSYSTEVVEIPTSTEVNVESYISTDEEQEEPKKSKSKKKSKLSNQDSIESESTDSGYSPLQPAVEPIKADTGFQPIQKENIPLDPKYVYPSTTLPIQKEGTQSDSQLAYSSSTENPSLPISNENATSDSKFVSPGNIQNPSLPIQNELAGSKDSNFFNPPSLLPNLPFNLNEKLSALYYSNEWDNFKKLPLKDRRSGRERRSKVSKLPANQKERRLGKDRRVSIEDKLKAREEFLKNWEKNIQTPENSQDFFPETILDSPYSSFGGNPLEFLPREPILPTSKNNLPTQPLEKLNLPTGSNLEQTKQPQETLAPQKQDLPPIPVSEVISQPIANTEISSLAKSSDSVPSTDSRIPDATKPTPSTQTQEGEKPKESPPYDSVGGAGQTVFSGVSEKIETVKIDLPDPKDYVRSKSGHLVDPFEEVEAPEITIEESDSELPEGTEEDKPEISGLPEIEEPKEQEKIIHGVLELKPPEIDDAPFLTLTYDFSKIPHPFRLSKNYSIMEYSYYKYKPMLMKAQEFARRKMLKNALNYYRVIKSQNIPPELKSMINRNIMDITEFLEKFTMSKGG